MRESDKVLTTNCEVIANAKNRNDFSVPCDTCKFFLRCYDHARRCRRDGIRSRDITLAMLEEAGESKGKQIKK